MPNLCGDPIQHFIEHIQSGRRLIDNKPQRCTNCNGYGFPRPVDIDIRRANSELIRSYYVDGTRLNVCTDCNGTGKASEAKL